MRNNNQLYNIMANLRDSRETRPAKNKKKNAHNQLYLTHIVIILFRSENSVLHALLHFYLLSYI